MDFPNKSNIQELRNIIYSNLDPIINKDFCLLDVPDYENIGDNLIWGGELAYLNRLPYQMRYTSSAYLCQKHKIPANTVLLLTGGGNFGDLWRVFHNFRNTIISNFKEHRIVMFPQSVHYQNLENLEKDKKIYSEHKDLTFCARDKPTYEFFKKHFTKNNVVLVPDMAFCLNLEKYHTEEQSGKILWMHRNDKEANSSYTMESIVPEFERQFLDMEDWPTYELSPSEKRKKEFIDRYDIAISKRLLKLPLMDRIIDSKHGMLNRNSLDTHMQMGINFINQYDKIYSTRLHGFILSVLLNKEVNILDNSYGKNSNFYKTWLAGFHKTQLLTN